MKPLTRPGKAEGRKQKAESRKQKAGSRKRKSAIRNPQSAIRNLVILAGFLVGATAETWAQAPPISYLANGGFERGAGPWSLEGATLDEATSASGQRSAKLTGGQIYQDVFDLAPGTTLTVAASLKVVDVRETMTRGYAYLAVYQLNDFGEIAAFHDFVQKTGTQDWERHSYTFEVAEDAAVVSIRAGLFQATGTVWFDDFTLVEGTEPAAYEEVTEEIMHKAELPGLERQAKGNVAIFQEDWPVGEGQEPLRGPYTGDPAAAPSSPERLAATLRAAGFGVALLDSGQLADKRVLNRAGFDVLILPYGPHFPVAAAKNFRRFLRSGGKFLSLGGYAFDNLLEKTDTGWRAYTPQRPDPVTDVRWHCQIPAEELRGKGPLTFSGWIRTQSVGGGQFAFYAVYQHDANGQLVEFKDVCQLKGSHGWEQHTYTFNVHEKAAVVDLHAGLWECRGVAWFDDVQITDQAGNVVFASDFEADFDPDAKGPRQWWRTDQERAEVVAGAGRDGSRCLKVRLRAALEEERLNTRRGQPGDGLAVSPSQLGVFDPDYRLERVAYAQGAPGQAIFPTDQRLEGPLEGYAASGVVGWNEARWQPLLNAYDRYGRLRGAAGALLRHYAGPWAGSTWAFFGVTNRDLWAQGPGPGAQGPSAIRHPPSAMDAALVRLVEALVGDVYGTAVIAEPPCVRAGEAVKLTVPVFNGGREAVSVRVAFDLFAENQSPVPSPQKQPAHRAEVVVEALPNQSTDAVIEWLPEQWTADFYRVQATLEIQDDGNPTLRQAQGDVRRGEPVEPRHPPSAIRHPPSAILDQLEGGFVVWNEAVVANGPPLRYHDNYLHYGDKPLLLFGTDDWSYVFNTHRETPLVWREDMQKRADFGVLIYENLQIGLPRSPEEREKFFRQVDGLVQLSQQYQQVYFPCLLCGYNVAVSDEELEQQADFVRAYAARYKDVPGLIYYLNGDLQCRITDAVKPQWHQFLRDRYGTIERLREAWGEEAAGPVPGNNLAIVPYRSFEDVPAEDYHDWGRAWESVKAYDYNLFKAWLIRRWTGRLIAAIRESDRTHPTTCEFYQLPHAGIDIPAAIGDLDLSNIGFFEKPLDDLRRFPRLLKYSDQRARGKSLGPGEYGVKTHPAWGDGKDYGYHITRTRAQALDLFLAVGHYSLGLGASRLHNWCWKDGSHHIFPWGMNYPCDNVEKDTLYAHRNQSLLFRFLSPVYEEPTVCFLTADSHRLGGAKWRVIEGILNGLHLALATHVDNLGVLNEHALEIPAPAKAIFYPLPYCPTDEAYGKLLDFVRRGGTLYLSGDVSYDQFRRRTKTARLEELCGVRFVSENYPNIDWGDRPPQFLANTPGIGSALFGNEVAWAGHPAINVEPVGAEPIGWTPYGHQPSIFRHRLGQGQVIFCTDPLELHPNPTEQDRRGHLWLYRHVLELANVAPLGLEPNDPQIHVMRTPLQGGGQVYVLFNADETHPARTVTLPAVDPPATLDLRQFRPALLWFDGQGRLRAAEVQGGLSLGGKRQLHDGTEGVVFSLDGEDLRRSKAVALLPLKPGVVRLRSAVDWAKPIAEVGEVRGGAWRTFETLIPARTPDGLQVTVGEDPVYSVILLCEEGQQARWRAVIERAMTKPGALVTG